MLWLFVVVHDSHSYRSTTFSRLRLSSTLLSRCEVAMLLVSLVDNEMKEKCFSVLSG